MRIKQNKNKTTLARLPPAVPGLERYIDVHFYFHKRHDPKKLYYWNPIFKYRILFYKPWFMSSWNNLAYRVSNPTFPIHRLHIKVPLQVQRVFPFSLSNSWSLRLHLSNPLKTDRFIIIHHEERAWTYYPLEQVRASQDLTAPRWPQAQRRTSDNPKSSSCSTPWFVGILLSTSAFAFLPSTGFCLFCLLMGSLLLNISSLFLWFFRVEAFRCLLNVWVERGGSCGYDATVGEARDTRCALYNHSAGSVDRDERRGEGSVHIPLGYLSLHLGSWLWPG